MSSASAIHRTTTIAPRSRLARTAVAVAAADRAGAVARRHLRLCLRLHRLDALHLAVELVAAADLRLCRLRALRLAVAKPALEHRLHQPLHLQRALCARRDGDRAAARHPHRPARARRGGLAHHLPLSARRLLRRHRHGVELAVQPDLGHRVLRARPRLDRLQLQLDHQPQPRDLRHRHHRHLAGLGLRHGAVPRRAALGRPGSHQGGADRRRRHGADLSARRHSGDRPDLRRRRWSCCCSSPSRPSIWRSR